MKHYTQQYKKNPIVQEKKELENIAGTAINYNDHQKAKMKADIGPVVLIGSAVLAYLFGGEFLLAGIHNDEPFDWYAY